MQKSVRHRNTLTFSAGPSAYREIKENGLALSRIGTLAGASGGAKWLVLSQLDRVMARKVLPALQGPVHMIGTSIGAWRFACYGQDDPLAAIDRFESAYLGQSYSEKPDRSEISARTREILDHVLGENGIAQILSHPVLRSHVLAVRSRHLLASEHPFLLGLGLVSAAAMNIASRRSLGAFFDRVLFHDERDRPPFFELGGFPMHTASMNQQNFRDVVLATGAIPLVLEGVRDISSAPRGMYRDGGVIDYHLDFPHSEPDRLALYLHFYNWLKPGWFDKQLSWRRSQTSSTDRTILVSPSPAFIARLPNAKVPDRHDFTNLAPNERVRIWRAVVKACEELADEFEDVLENDRLAERVELMEAR